MTGDKTTKNKFPPNLYKVGDSWMVDFVFRGQRYRENIGPVSRTVAQETRDRRKGAAAEGRLSVNGKKWTDGRWVESESEARFQDPSFAEALDQYLEWHKANHTNLGTHVSATYAAKPLREFFGEYSLSHVSPFLVEKYKIERQKVCECTRPIKGKSSSRCGRCSQRFKPLKPATIDHELTLLKHLFRLRVELNLSPANPIEKIKLFKVENARDRYLSQEEAERLLIECNPDFRVVVLTAMLTGCRSSELKSLRWSSVDTVNRTITVRRSYSKNNQTKTVPMTDDVFAAFEEMHQERDRGPEGLVFVNRYGKPWKSWRTAFENACKRAGITDFHFHDLRHCFGSWLEMTGTTGKTQMELMGHKDPKMTMRYTHLSMDHKRCAVEKLPRFGAKSPQIPPSEQTAKLVALAK